MIPRVVQLIMKQSMARGRAKTTRDQEQLAQLVTDAMEHQLGSASEALVYMAGSMAEYMAFPFWRRVAELLKARADVS